MEWPSLPLESWRPAQPAILVLALLAGFILLLWSSSHSKGSHAGEGTKEKLPPGPFIWPMVGCLPAVGFKHRHRTFYKLSKKYGPVMQVPIGAAKLIVVHGTAMAQELLKTQDAHFSSRPLSMTGAYLGFDHADVNLTPFNSNWQATRKALSLHLLSPSKLAFQAAMRRYQVCSSVSSLFHKASIEPGTVVNVSSFADRLITNIIVRMLFGNRYRFDSNQACSSQNPAALTIYKALQDFDPDLREGIFLWGELNLADFFPVLAPLDLQGLERRFRRLRKKLENLFELIIQEHRNHPHEGEEEDDFIGMLLSQKQLSDKQLMGIMSEKEICGDSNGTGQAAISPWYPCYCTHLSVKHTILFG
ncbi:hypothetical protein GOP47_0013673 [Adiantum capillus-veneris]|uniref:Cytochrome P450 n=1 Tax=Adiantum capillus-veneris TaxID=13818 RepID=A0A9D4ZES3_ADICA|nr:hypothetical protein GOP47_0013673 [Adiantum capillus-veneris]